MPFIYSQYIEISFRGKNRISANSVARQLRMSNKIHRAKSNNNYYKTIWKFIPANGGADELMANAAMHPKLITQWVRVGARMLRICPMISRVKWARVRINITWWVSWNQCAVENMEILHISLSPGWGNLSQQERRLMRATSWLWRVNNWWRMACQLVNERENSETKNKNLNVHSLRMMQWRMAIEILFFTAKFVTCKNRFISDEKLTTDCEPNYTESS